MPNIGVILAGGSCKGAYEIGCLRAIEDYFGMDSIKCISSASVGSVVGQSYAMDRSAKLEHFWKTLDVKKYGRMILSYASNDDIFGAISKSVAPDRPLPYEHYVSIWNFTQSKLEYIPFHELQGDRLLQYMRAAISIPFFCKGELIDGNRTLDGAFLDNIPVYPLLEKDLDYIFCIYFDNCKYFFENETIDSKIIKLFDFPNEKMLEVLSFHPENFDAMLEFGYNYATKTIRELFADPAPQAVYAAIDAREKRNEATYTTRFTADIVLNNINIMTKRYSKSLATRTKEKISAKSVCKERMNLPHET